MIDRRGWLLRSAAAAGSVAGALGGAGLAGLAAGCRPAGDVRLPPSRWVGQSPARGHRLREGAATIGAPAVQRRADVLVIGAGVAGFAAVRALRAAGIDDIALLESEPAPGGNSRGHEMAGMACPLGAHYLPVPGAAAHEVQALLSELGVARWSHGRWVYDERHLCHSPQERLFIDGAWHEGLLPPAEPGSVAAQQGRRFSQAVTQAQRDLGFAMPTLRARWTPGHAALDAVTFASWLRTNGFSDARLLAHLDYCCRDDYGAGVAQVSAWAGLHYFASRHGFPWPGDDEAEREPVLTWPEGNAWLTKRMAAGLGARLHLDRTVLRLDAGRHSVSALVRVNGHNSDSNSSDPDVIEQWTARQVVLAVPLHVAACVWTAPPSALTNAAGAVPHAPWLVANLHIDQPLLDRVGAPPAWDNVIAGGASLGYVDATHQSLRPYAGATVLTAYWALSMEQRATLLDADPKPWARRVLAELQGAHPDLPQRVQAIDLARWGHAMAVPVPGVRGNADLMALSAAAESNQRNDRVRLAHADLAGYSVFEEAYTRGWRCGAQVARVLRA